jgi:hypothetical protein
VKLGGLRLKVPKGTIYGVWAETIVEELAVVAARRDDSAAATLLLGLVFAAPRGMVLKLPRGVGVH